MQSDYILINRNELADLALELWGQRGRRKTL